MPMRDNGFGFLCQWSVLTSILKKLQTDLLSPIGHLIYGAAQQVLLLPDLSLWEVLRQD